MLKILSLLKKNKKLFNYNSNKKQIILVEYNNFHGSHLCQALLANFFKRKNSSRIIAYFNYCVIVSPLKINLLQKFKWKISNLLSLGFRKIYRSFGVEDFFRPVLSDNISNKAKKIRDKYFKNSINNRDIVNLKVDKIWIGDLMYDTYLKSRLVPTLDPNTKDFKKFFKEFLELFFYWRQYFKSNKVSQLIGVHSCYSYGIPFRIAINKGIPSYIINTRAVMKIDKKIPTMYGDFKFHKKKFKNLDKNKKIYALKLAKQNLENRIKGYSGLKGQLYNRTNSSFKKFKKNSKPILIKNKKIKILICTHDFMDSIHVKGKNFFSDFYRWISFLGELSIKKKNEYDFYIKNHPSFGNKYERYQKYTEIFVEELIKKFPLIKKIPNNTSHHKLIKEGIDYVLTVYGSVGIEYAYLGIPVLNASKNNPHINYKFNINPVNKQEYIKILNNLKNINLEIKRKHIYECYFMKHFYYDDNWLFDDYKTFMNSIGGYQNIHTNNLYKYWFKNIDEEHVKKIYNRFENFMNSNEYRLTINNSKKEDIILGKIN